MRIIIMAMVLIVSSSTSALADVYKCKIKGEWVFSDQPCSRDAEKVEMNLYQPKAEDIDKQRRMTKRYTEDSQYDELEALRAKNDALKLKITQLENQREAALKTFDDRMYAYSDTLIATHEQDLFKQINDVKRDYHLKIMKVQSEIQQNEARIFSLKVTLDAQNQ